MMINIWLANGANIVLYMIVGEQELQLKDLSTVKVVSIIWETNNE